MSAKKEGITLTIAGKLYTVEQAKQLYDQLHELFGKTEGVLPYMPSDTPHDPWFNPWERDVVTTYT
jgi:hypothetical protein